MASEPHPPFSSVASFSCVLSRPGTSFSGQYSCIRVTKRDIRQLVAHGKVDEASTVLTRIYPTSTEDQRRAKIHSIEMSIAEATQTMVDDSVFKTLARIFTNMATFRAVFTACTIMAISQLSGFNTLMYYSATLFKIVGFNNATAVAITVSATNFVFSFVNLIIVDRFGRRKILLVTILGMTVCLVVAAVSFAYIPIDLHTLEVQSDNIGWPGMLLIAVIILFVGFYSSGVATVAWIGSKFNPSIPIPHDDHDTNLKKRSLFRWKFALSAPC